MAGGGARPEVSRCGDWEAFRIIQGTSLPSVRNRPSLIKKKEGISLKIYIKNQTEKTIELCCGMQEYTIKPDDQIVIEVQDEDCMYIDNAY